LIAIIKSSFMMYYIEQFVRNSIIGAVELSSTRLPITYLFNLFRCWCDINNSPTKIKQRTFTTRLIPIMERAGWQYNKKDLKPLEGFQSIDLDRLKRMDKDGRYTVIINEHDRQGLFFKK
ncbi:primase-like DNA-binding domain-containing protein, partial [Latilactobacillus sakei]|uniref:primase-like DNA-binding domain-containing protein n=1 Tax=Latilactobacillus sakei TaxID=1599 RepID=UPI0025B5C107